MMIARLTNGRTLGGHVWLPLTPSAEQISMVMPAEVRHRWTAREVRELIAASPLASPRYELVDGELLVTPSPGPSHQTAVTLLIVALNGYLERERLGFVFTSPSDVELEPEFLTQPDIFVVPTAEWRRGLRDGFPVYELSLAVEILSPSSGRHDRVRKRPLYQRHVPEYWIFDLEARLVERWTPGDERPEGLTDTLEWRPAGAAEPLSLALGPFFATVFGEE